MDDVSTQRPLCLMVGWMSHLAHLSKTEPALAVVHRRKKAGTTPQFAPPIFLRITSPYSTVTVMSLSEVHAHAPRPSTSFLHFHFVSSVDKTLNGVVSTQGGQTAMSRLAASSLRQSREREKKRDNNSDPFRASASLSRHSLDSVNGLS